MEALIGPWYDVSLDEFAELASSQEIQHKPGCPAAGYTEQVLALCREFGFAMQAARAVRPDDSVYTIFRRKPEEPS